MTGARGVALRTVGLRFSYPDGTRALDGVDLSIGPGECVAIVGQNGSGKSTLVRHFNGLLRATEGDVEVAGEPVGRRHVADLARVVGIAFQDPDRQIFAGGVAEEVAFGPRNLGVPAPAVDERVAEALATVGLDGRADANPYDLGYSERKLLGLAAILAMRTPAVVLDEPTTGQDAAGVARVRSIVAALSGAGRTVVGISHDMRFVAETFERVIVMRAGRVIGDGPPGEAFSEANWESLASTFLEPPLAARVAAREALGPIAGEPDLIEALVRRGRR